MLMKYSKHIIREDKLVMNKKTTIKEVTMELNEIVGQLDLKNLLQVISFAKDLLDKQNKGIYDQGEKWKLKTNEDCSELLAELNKNFLLNKTLQKDGK